MSDDEQPPPPQEEVEEDPPNPQGEEESKEDDIQNWVDPEPHISVDELEMRLMGLRKNNDYLSKETVMYEDYLQHQISKEKEINGTDSLDALSGSKSTTSMISVMSDITDVSEVGQPQQPQQQQQDQQPPKTPKSPRTSRRRSKRNTSRAKSSRKTEVVALTLTATQRANIAADKHARLTKSSAHTISRLEEEIGDMQATIAATTESLQRVEEQTHKFQKVANQSKNYQGQVNADSLLRYLIDKSKIDAGNLDSLMLRTQVARRELAQAKAKQQRTEDLEGSITMVDFEQIGIINQQYSQKVKEGNVKLLAEKTKVMHSTHQLNELRDTLRDLQQEIDKLTKATNSINRLRAKLEKEHGHVAKEVRQAKAVNTKLRTQLERFQVPSVLEYIQEKADVQKTKQSLHSWSRRVDISEQELSKTKGKLNTLKVAPRTMRSTGPTSKIWSY